MRHILIFYEHVSREYESCLLLKGELERDKRHTVEIFSMHFELYDAILYNIKYDVDIILIPYAYKKLSIKQFHSILRKKNRPLIINFHHEQIGALYNEHRLFPIDEITKNNIIHFAWTDLFREKLIKHGVNEENIYITGNIRTDLLFHKYSQKTKNMLATKYNLNSSKKWILLCETGNRVFSDDRIKTLSNRGFSENELILRNEKNAESFEKTIEDLNNLDNKFFEKFELIYRAHPGTSIKGTLNKNIATIDELSVYEWFKVVDLNVSRSSTTLFESEMCGVPSVNYLSIEYPNVLQTFGVNEYTQINSLSEINIFFVEELKKNLGKQQIAIKYLGMNTGSVAKFMSDTIKRILENEETNKNLKEPLKVGNCFYTFRKVLSNLLSKFRYKAFPSKSHKFPRSLFVFSNDVPPKWKNRKGEF